MTDKNLCEKTRALLARGARLVDVRSHEEFLRGALRNAINLPLHLLGQAESLFAKDQPLVLYCASGRRSAMARRILERAGYQQVIDAGAAHRLAACQASQ